MGYQKITVPADGDKITVNADLSLNVPNYPIILSAEMMLRCAEFGDAVISHM